MAVSPQCSHSQLEARWVGAALLCLIGMLLTGCGPDPAKSSSSRDQPSASSTQHSASPSAPMLPRAVAPAADAGGICRKTSYELIKRETGLSFDIAAFHRSKQSGGDAGSSVESCTLRSAQRQLPDLTLTFAAGKLDAKAFKERFTPQGAQDASGLGEGAYTIVHSADPAPDVAVGPSYEVGWFTNAGSFTLVVTTEPRSDPKRSTALAGKLLALGKKLQ